MKKFLKILRTAGVIIGTFFICLFLSINSQIKSTKIVDSEFLFTSIGVLLGFAFSLLAFIVSMLDKISLANIDHKTRTDEKKTRVKNIVTSINNEIKQDIYFIFITFVVSGLIILTEKSDIPFIKSVDVFLYQKTDILTGIKLTMAILNMLAIYDLLGITFKVSNATADVDTDSAK